MTDVLPDEAFEASTYRCSRGHSTREMEEVEQHPGDPWTRHFVCPVCEFSFWEKIDVDEGSAVQYQSDEELPF